MHFVGKKPYLSASAFFYLKIPSFYLYVYLAEAKADAEVEADKCRDRNLGL
jgi:hypothetical protein